MKKRTRPPSRAGWLAATLAILLPVLAMPLGAIAADRVVLCEEFTSHG